MYFSGKNSRKIFNVRKKNSKFKVDLYFRLLFTRNDEKLIKEYVQRQLVKILTYQKINVADFIFAREVRFGTYKSDEINRLPLSAIAAKQMESLNPRHIVSFAERVPFVIVSKPFSKLYQQVVELNEFLSG
jgi:hypothetical protein